MTDPARTTVDEPAFVRWLDDYESAWRATGTGELTSLFTPDATYLQSPVEAPHIGIAAIAAMWDEQRDGPDEPFTMTSEVVAFSGSTGVARVEVRYGDPVVQEYVDLWVVTFAPDGRCLRFEEWAYWPGRSYTASHRTEPVIVHADDLVDERYGEWIRSQDLSAGVYRLPAGGVDDQSPHREDEVYAVLSGAATMEIEGVRTPVRAGSQVFVPKRAQHRFVDITEDIVLAVMFAPPEMPA